MKATKLFLVSLSILGSSIVFIGCSNKDLPKPVIKTVYVDKVVPKPLEKPIGNDFDLMLVKFNDKEYYVVSKDEGKVLASNWVTYKAWAETNYEILKKASE